MEQWVVDASVLVQSCIVDSETSRVFTLLSTMANPVPAELNVPEFCLLECANVLWKYTRFDPTRLNSTTRTLRNLLELPLVYHQATPLLTRALTLGLTHGLAIYDSLYIVLAQDLNCPLITVDQRQTQAALASGVSLKPITDFSPA